MSVHDAAWHTGLFFYVLVRPLLIGTGGLSKWRKSVIAQSGCWARVAAGRRARHTGVRSPRRKQQSCVQTTAEVLAKKKKSVCWSLDSFSASLIAWTFCNVFWCCCEGGNGASLTWAVVRDDVEFFFLKRSQWCDHTSVPNEAQFVSLIYQHYFKEALWALCFDFRIQKSYFVLVSSPEQRDFMSQSGFIWYCQIFIS